MNLDISTVNLVLGAILAFNAWVVRSLIELRRDLAKLTTMLEKHDEHITQMFRKG